MKPGMEAAAFSPSNPRKRAYPHDSAQSLATSHVENESSQQGLPSDEQNVVGLRKKRSRINEWPLKNTVNSSDGAALSPRSTQGKRKPSRGQLGKWNTRKRGSKFLEGSLNDKPSKQPPAAFVGAEDAMEQYHKDEHRHGQGPIPHNAGVEEARPSATFGFGRFGKAVAHVFSGFWKEKDPLELSHKSGDVDDRKVKAEEAYAVLKAQGFKGIRSVIEPQGRQSSLNERRVAAYAKDTTSSRGSDLENGKLQSSSSQIPDPIDANKGLQPPSNPGRGQSISPGSVMSAGRRSSSLHFRTPSFQSIKKVKSQVHLPSVPRSTDKLPQQRHQDAVTTENVARGLRRQPSKRDLAKHEKLSKKVSNLESKLEVARRDLEKSLKGAPPIPDLPEHRMRKPFTPGGLASLPSESLLTPQMRTAPIAQSNAEISGSDLVSREINPLSSPSRQLYGELEGSCVVPSTHRNSVDDSMSSDPISRPVIKAIDHTCMVAAQAAKHRRHSSSHSSKKHLAETKTSSTTKSLQHTKNPKIQEHSPPQSDEDPPPLPPKSITTDEVDKPRPDSPFLGRPIAAPPGQTRTKNHARKISPSAKTSTSSGKKKKAHFSIYDEQLDTALTPDSAAGNRQKVHAAKGSPAPRAVQIRAARAKAVKVSLEKGRVEKPLPKIRKEEKFEWDEDVF